MGLVRSFAHFIGQSVATHGPLQNTLTLGRQSSLLRPADVRALAPGVAGAIDRYCAPATADALLRDMFGATTLRAMDASPYEAADIVHDLNRPVDPQHWACFDTIVDGGTLEHVFNVPTAFENVMRMVRVGGRVFMATPTNNHCGHGFYQFSPELLFRVFSHDRGFTVRRLELFEHPFPGVELSSAGRSFDVADPASLGARVQLVTTRPVMAYVEALKVAAIDGELPTPQQSDYSAKWRDATAPAATSAARPSLRHRLSAAFDRWPWGRGTYQRVFESSLRNRRAFRRIR